MFDSSFEENDSEKVFSRFDVSSKEEYDALPSSRTSMRRGRSGGALYLMDRCSESVMLWSTGLLQLLSVGILCVSYTDAFRFDDPGEVKVAPIVFLSFIQIAQIVVDIFGTAHLLTRLHKISLGSAWRYYIVMITSFTGRYLLIYVSSGNAFANSYSDKWAAQKMYMIEMVVHFFYFSTACQTGVGYGDIAPNYVISEMMAVLQMAIGIAFSVYIISMTLSQFVDDSLPTAPTGPVESILSRVKHNETIQSIRRKLRKYLLISTLAWQVFATITLYLLTVNKSTYVRSNAGRYVVITICFVFQGIQCASLLFVSLKFVRKTRQVTISFLAQSYGAFVLSFAGIYLAIYVLLLPDDDDDDDSSQMPFYFNQDDPTFFTVILKLLYFSCVTMTTTGFGLIKPQVWAAQLVVVIQMLISTLYYVVIFGLGMSRYLNADSSEAVKWKSFHRLSADFDDRENSGGTFSRSSSSRSSDAIGQYESPRRDKAQFGGDENGSGQVLSDDGNEMMRRDEMRASSNPFVREGVRDSPPERRAASVLSSL